MYPCGRSRRGTQVRYVLTVNYQILGCSNVIDHDNLEDFADPETYDIVAGDDAGVAFYTELAWEAGGPVLEIACGTGRVGIPIARAGFAVTGVDIVPGMIDRARAVRYTLRSGERTTTLPRLCM